MTLTGALALLVAFAAAGSAVVLVLARLLRKGEERAPGDGSYAGLADGRGYVLLYTPEGVAVRAHVEFLRAVTIEDAEGFTGVPVASLRRWADGAAAPLGLWQ